MVGPGGGAGSGRAGGGAGVSIAEWSPPQAAAWLRGLNSAIAPYVPLFLARKVRGQQLLTLRSDDLESLGVKIIGHQELLLEAIEHLRNFHYELQRENLQQLAMRLSCVATSLYNELRLHQDSTKVETQCLSDLAHVIAAVKPLVCWLDRSPFFEQIDYSERKSALLKLSLEAATCAQRDRFAERPAQAVAAACRQLAALADYIIQDVADPMILQPASLDTVVLKKKDNQLGFDIVPSFSGHHQITNIKFGSPAHASGKIEEGDEIVQVNHQTVIGWCPDLARQACLSFPPGDPNHTPQGHSLSKEDLILTLRRRPGARSAALATPQLRPFRPLKRPWAGGGVGGNIMPNRIRFWDNRDVLALRFRVPSVEPTPEVEEGDRSSSDESEILSPPSSPTTLEQDAQLRLYLPKPRSQVHRRNTISGSSPISKRPNVSIEQFWQELKNHKSLNHTGSAQMGGIDDHEEISNNLYRRDKAMSVSTGLELSPRPKTCLGVSLNHSLITKLKVKNKFLNDENANPTEASNGDTNSSKNRGKLDKSHSTPAYDFDSNGNEPNSLVTQIIPESPTTPTDSPTIIIHSAEKADQILDFKKSSSQIGEAILHQQNKQKDSSAEADSELKFSFPAVDNSKFREGTSKNVSKTGSDKIMETINIAMLERQNKDIDKKITTKQSSYKAQSIFVSNKGEKSTKTFSVVNEHVQTIQNEIVQAINEQRLITTMQITKTKQILSDVPPEPPPRPLSTQRPSYAPKEYMLPIKDHRMKDYPPLKSVKNADFLEPKDYPPLKPVKPEISPHIPTIKHFTKQDIHMIPNVDMNPPLLPNRKEILVPINYEAKDIPKSVLSFEKKNNQFNVMSNPDLTSKSINLSPDLGSKTSDLSPLTQSQSLQRLESEGRATLIIPSPSRMEASKVMSPTNSVVRGIFPSTKSKSLKKKNSILAKRRKVSVKDLGPGDLQGTLHQRCRTKSNTTVVWDQKWYVLQGNTLYGFKSKDCSRADCLIFLNGFTVSAAQEVKSKQFAFKVYHTGTVFYFAAESHESMNTWYEYISKATMLNYDSWERAHKKDKKVDESKHFSETDYSDDDFSPDKDCTEKHKNEGKEKEKSKFGSLKKFTNRIHKSESQENVSHSTSLDRKYLRFFSSKSSKHKEEKAKAKNLDIPVPTEQYRSYRKIPNSSQTVILQVSQTTKLPSDLKEDVSEKLSQNLVKNKKIEPVDNKVTSDTDNLLKVPKSQKIPKPINYAHASNPNLLDFEKSDFVAKPSPQKPKIQRPDNVLGFVTLEQFMLKKQEEDRREVYSNRVLMGIERDSRKEEKNSSSKKAAKELQKQWEKIVPDVIYGELPTHEEALLPVSVEQIQNRTLPKTPEKPSTSSSDVKSHEYVHIPDDITKKDSQITNKDNSKPISVKGKDGYEKIVYSAVSSDIKNPDEIQKEPPKILPRKHSLVIPEDLSNASPDIFKKCSPKTIKDISYELIYADGKHKRSISNCSDLHSSDSKSISKNVSTTSSRDLGYETVYGTEKSTDSVSKKSSTSSIASSQIDDIRMVPRKTSGEKPVPPPKIMPKSKQVLNRQSSLTSNSNRNSGPDMNPVFVQGESPEKFWLNSLRRNDKVHNSKAAESAPKNDKFYTKRSEPSFTKSSEATIVKSDKVNKNIEPFQSKTGETKVLKSATQYTPMSLPLNASNALKTSPKFEMMLDSKDPPATTGISRLRQIFQHSAQSASKLRPSTPSPTGSVKEKTILGSPRLHRAIFRKQLGAAQPTEDFCQEFTYTKGPQVDSYPDNHGIFPVGNIADEMTTMRNMSTPEYPHLEYPPTFEPESYSLADPNTSFNLLRRKNMGEKK